MKLLMSPASPFVRKVRVLLREADLLDTVEEIEVSTTPLASDPTVVSANPTGKIPALVRDDGPAIYDSRVITRYLDDHANAGLYPAARIWDVLTLEATADAIMEAAVLITYEGRMRPAEKQFDDWTDAQWGKAIRAVGAINDRWMSQLSGPLDMGQISVGCALGYLDLRHDARGWRNGNAELAQWYAQFAQRDSMIATAL
ncbi:MAG: glutathione S-transferase [Yoonia sp.]|jgi:glutathione S-transferase